MKKTSLSSEASNAVSKTTSKKPSITGTNNTPMPISNRNYSSSSPPLQNAKKTIKSCNDSGIKTS